MIKELIIDIRKQLKNFDSDLYKLRGLYPTLESKDNKRVFKLLNKLIKKYPANPVLLTEALFCLQLCNDDSIIEEYGLKYVKEVFVKSCAIFQYDVDLNMEHYYYLYNVDNNEKQAKSELKKLRKRVLDKLTPHYPL